MEYPDWVCVTTKGICIFRASLIGAHFFNFGGILMELITTKQYIGAKEAYEQMECLCESMMHRPLYDFCANGIDLKEILRRDTTDFLLCLSACDKELTFCEKEVITGLTKSRLLYDDMKKRIIDKKLTSKEFRRSVPEILCILVSADLPLLGLGKTYGKAYFSTMLLSLFKLVGDIVISQDNNISETERETYKEYISNMDKYITLYCLL